MVDGPGSHGPVRPEGQVGVVSCVVDSHPRFSQEVLRWYATATRLAGILSTDLVVNMVGDHVSGVASFLRSEGVPVRSIRPLDSRSPHCNKIAGALALAGEPMVGACVLTDTDVILLQDPRTIPVPAGSVGMRPADLPNPPLKRLRKLFTEAGVPEPPTVLTPWQRPIDMSSLPLRALRKILAREGVAQQLKLEQRRGAATLAGNGNGGLYVVPEPIFSTVVNAWSHWARWLLDRRYLLGDWAVNVDQVAMALALAAENVDVFDVGERWNVSTHSGRLSEHQPLPAMIHYHGTVDPGGNLSTIGRPDLDELVARANQVTADVRSEMGQG